VHGPLHLYHPGLGHMSYFSTCQKSTLAPVTRGLTLKRELTPAGGKGEGNAGQVGSTTQNPIPGLPWH
jgi:hypothetical protein